jgi:serine/threonine-protein kinase
MGAATAITIDRRFRLVEQIGVGGMGEVYRAEDRLTGQTVALKRVTVASQQIDQATSGSSLDFRLALAQEFKMLASLRHPNIISVLD